MFRPQRALLHSLLPMRRNLGSRRSLSIATSRMNSKQFWPCASVVPNHTAFICRGMATDFKEEDEKEPVSQFQALKPKLMNVRTVLWKRSFPPFFSLLSCMCVCACVFVWMYMCLCDVLRIQGAMVVGAGVTAYGISNIIWDMTKMFITLTPAATGYYGFMGGIVSTSILGGLAYYTERW